MNQDQKGPLDGILTPLDNNNNYKVDRRTQTSIDKGYTTNVPIRPLSSISESRSLDHASQYDEERMWIDDTEDYRAQRQTVADKFANDLIKGIGTTGSTFISTGGLLTMGIANLLTTGDLNQLYNNPISKAASHFNDWMEEQLPNYYTREELESSNPFKGIVPFTTGSANFWFDKILKNAGFTVGSIGAGMALNKILGLGAKAIALGNTAIAEEALAGNVINALSKAKGIKFPDINTLAVGVGAGAMGEAGVEAIHNYESSKELLTKHWVDTHPYQEMTDKDYAEIEDLALSSANAAFLLNTALLSWSDWIQFGKLFGGKNVAKNALREITEKQVKDGVELVAKPVSKLEKFGSIGKAFVTESFEEGSQFGIEKGTQDYFMRKYDDPSIDWLTNLSASIATGTKESLATKEGLENWIIGGISGSLFGSVTNKITGKSWLDTKPQEDYERTKKLVDVLNPYWTGNKKLQTLLEGTVRGKAIQDQLNLANEKEDVFEFQNLKSEELLNVATTAIKLGKFDSLMDKLEDVGHMKEEDFKTSFGLDYDGNQKTIREYVDNVRQELSAVKKVHDLIEDRHPEASEDIKDRLVRATFGIDNIDAREEEISKKISDITEGKIAYNLTRKMWDKPGEKESFEKDFNDQLLSYKKENPAKYDFILPYLKDLKKLRERRQAFIEAYNAFTKPEAQIKLEKIISRVKEEAKEKFDAKTSSDKEKLHREWNGAEVVYNYDEHPDKDKHGEVTGTVRIDGDNLYFHPTKGQKQTAIMPFHPEKVLKRVTPEDVQKRELLNTRVEVLTKLIADIKERILNKNRPNRAANKKRIEELRIELDNRVKELKEAASKLSTQTKVKVIDAEGQGRFKTSVEEIEDLIDELLEKYAGEIQTLREDIEALELDEKNLKELGLIYVERINTLNETKDPLGFKEMLDEIEEIKKEQTLVGEMIKWAKEALQKLLELYTAVVSKLTNLNRKSTLEQKAVVDETVTGLKQLEAEFNTLELKKVGYALEVRRLDHALEMKRIQKRRAQRDKGRPDDYKAGASEAEPSEIPSEVIGADPPKKDAAEVLNTTAGNDGGINNTPEQDRFFGYTDKMNMSSGIYSLRAVSKANIPDEWKDKIDFYDDDTIQLVLYKDGEPVMEDGELIYTTMFTGERILLSEGYVEDIRDSKHTNKSNLSKAEIEKRRDEHNILRNRILKGETLYFGVQNKSKGFPIYADPGPVLNRIIDTEEEIPNIQLVIKEDAKEEDFFGRKFTAKPGMVFIRYNNQIVPVRLQTLEYIENGVETVVDLINKYINAKDDKEAARYRRALKGIINWGKVREDAAPKTMEIYLSKDRSEIYFNGIAYPSDSYPKDLLVQFLNRKYINVNKLKLGDKGKYVDPISGKTFPSYKHYLFSAYAEGKERLNSQIPIRVMLKPNDSRQYKGVYLTYTSKTFDSPNIKLKIEDKIKEVATEKGTAPSVPSTSVSGTTPNTLEAGIASLPTAVKGDAIKVVKEQDDGSSILFEFDYDGSTLTINRVVKTTKLAAESLDTNNFSPQYKEFISGLSKVLLKSINKEHGVETAVTLLTGAGVGITEVRIVKPVVVEEVNPLEGAHLEAENKPIETPPSSEPTTELPDENSLFKLFEGEDSLSDEEREKEINKIKALLPKAVADRIETVIGLIENRGVGRLTQDGRILLSTLMSAGTAYHEAFHAVSTLLLTKEERASLYNAWREENKSALSDREVEERLAEAFEEFMLNDPPKPESFIEKIFRNILDFIKWLVGTYDKKSEVQKMFNKIARGGFRKASIQQYGRVNYDKPFVDIHKKEWSAAFTDGFMQGMTYFFFKRLFESSDSISLDSVLSVDPVSHTVRRDLYMRTKADLITDVTNNSTDTKKRDLLVKWIEDNFQGLVNHHGDYLEKFGLEVTLNDEENYEEEGRGKDYTVYVDTIKFSPRAGATAKLKLLLASLPRMQRIDDRDTIVKHPLTRTPMITDLGTTFGILQNALAGVQDFEAKLLIVKGLANVRPEFNVLLDRLGITINSMKPGNNSITPIGMSSDKVYLQNQFNQQFTKTHINYKINLLTEKSNYQIDANSSTNVNRIINRWKQNGRRNFGSGASLYTIDKNGNLLFDPAKLEDISFGGRKFDIGNDSHKIAFLRVLGIEFSNLEFDSPKQLSDFREAVNKIHLYGMKENLLNIFDSGAVLTSIKTLAEFEASNNLESQELQLINAEGETVYEISLNDYISIITDEINFSGIDSLIHLSNPYTDNSVWKKIIKKEPGSLKKVLLGGIQPRGEMTEGTITSDLKPGDYRLYIVQSILNWNFPLMRAADRKLEKGFSINFEEYADIRENRYLNTFIGYLRDELVVVHNRERGVGRDVQFYKDNRKSLGVFDYLPDYLWKDRGIDDVINDSAVHQKVLEYIEEQCRINKQDLIDYKIFTVEGKDSFKSHGLDLDILKKLLEEERAITTLRGDQVDDIVKHFTVRSLIANIEQTKLYLGDVTQYKNLGDASKRFSGALGTKKLGRTDKYLNEWLNNNWDTDADGKSIGRLDKPDMNGDFKVAVLKDVIVYSKQFIDDGKSIADAFGLNIPNDHYAPYEKINETDGQGYITLPEYREFFIRLGEWNPARERAYQIAMGKGTAISADLLQMLPPIKPQYFGPKGQSKMFSMLFMKCSLMPLIPSMIADKPALKTLNERMLKNGVGIAVYESGVKVGAKQTSKGFQSLYDENGFPNKEEEMEYDTLNYKFLGVQLDIDTKDRRKGTSVIFGTQFRKMILSNLMDAGQGNKKFRVWNEAKQEYVKKDSEDIVKDWVRLNSLLIDKALDRFKKEVKLEISDVNGSFVIKDISALRKVLVKALEDRQVPLNQVDAVNNILADKSDIKLLDLSSNKDRLESVLYAIVTNSLIKQKVHGEALIQGSSAGFETKGRLFKNLSSEDKKNIVWLSNQDTLKFYGYDGKKITRMQVLLPHYFRKAYERAGSIDNIPKDLLELIGFRIPTQGLNSIEAMEVAGFLPESAGNLIVVPSEITAKTGSDFDVDKINVFFPHFEVDFEGKMSRVKSSEDSVEGIHNKLLDTAAEILLSPDSFEELTKSIDASVLKNAAREIRKAKKTASPDKYHKIVEFKYNSDLAQDFWVSKGALGIAARHNTFHVLASIAGLEAADSDKILNFKHYNKTSGGHIVLGSKYDAKKRHKISDIISEFITAYVDVVKENFVNTLNAGTQTSDTWMYLIHAGVPVETVAYFMTQPIIIDYIKAQAINESEFIKVTKAAGNISKNKLVAMVKNAFIKKAGLSKVEKRTVPVEHTESSLKASLNLDNIINNTEAVKTQLQILDDFLNIQEQAKDLTAVLHATTQDTKGAGKNRWEARLTHEKFNQVAREGKFRNLDKIIQLVKDKSFRDFDLDDTSVIIENGTKLLQPFHNVVSQSGSFFNSLFIADHPNIRHVLDDLFTIFIGKTQEGVPLLKNDEIIKNMRHAENDLVTYILANVPVDNVVINNQIKKLVHGNNSLAIRFQKLLDIVPEDKKTALKNNLIFKELIPVIKLIRDGNDSDIISMNNRRLDLYDSDALITSMRELRDLYGPEVKQFYKDLIYLSIIQSGLDDSQTTFRNAIPEEDYRELAIKALSYVLNDQNLNIDAFTDIFFRNNYWRSTIVPQIAERHWVNFEGNSGYSYVRYNPSTQTLDNIPSTKDNEKKLSFPYVVVRFTPEDMTEKEAELLKKRGRRTSTEYALYKYIGDPDVRENKWVRVDLLGNKWDLKELYDSANKPSVIPDNAVAGSISTETPSQTPITKPASGRTVAIIGTAGRTRVPTIEEWNNMLQEARSRVKKDDTLISGGAAVADHIAVKLFLEGRVSGLKLKLPARIKDNKFIGEPRKTAGGIANYYHEVFSKLIGVNTIAEIEEAIRKGAEVTYEADPSVKSMFIRNSKVAAESNAMIAYTYGEGNSPADGGTKDTWDKAKYSDKVHVPIHKITNANSRRFTPENITSLKPNEVFVFGSNTEGKHGLGAAKIAKDKFGAVYGQAKGLQGQSYAIVTKDLSKGKRSVSLQSIENQFDELFEYADNTPDKKFYVTKLGTDLAGFSINEIKSILEKINKDWISNDRTGIPDNIILPKEFEVRDSPQYLQQSNESYEPADQALNQKIKDFLAEIGVKVEGVNNLKDRQGNPIKGVALADILNKIIQVVEGQADITTLPEEAAHFFVELLPDSNPLLQKMLKDIVNDPIYSEVWEEYKDNPLYQTNGRPDEIKIKKEAIGKKIASEIINQHKSSLETNTDSFTRWWNLVWEWFKNVFKRFQKAKFEKAVVELSPYSEVAKSILSKDTSSIRSIDELLNSTEEIQNINTVIENELEKLLLLPQVSVVPIEDPYPAVDATLKKLYRESKTPYKPRTGSLDYSPINPETYLHVTSSSLLEQSTMGASDIRTFGDRVRITSKFLKGLHKNIGQSTRIDTPFKVKDARPFEEGIVNAFYNDFMTELKAAFKDKELPKVVPNKRLSEKFEQWLNLKYPLYTHETSRDRVGTTYGLSSILKTPSAFEGGGEVYISDGIGFKNNPYGNNHPSGLHRLGDETKVTENLNSLGWFIYTIIDGVPFIYEYQSDILPEISEGAEPFKVKISGDKEDGKKISINGTEISLNPEDLETSLQTISELIARFIEQSEILEVVKTRADASTNRKIAAESIKRKDGFYNPNTGYIINTYQEYLTNVEESERKLKKALDHIQDRQYVVNLKHVVADLYNRLSSAQIALIKRIIEENDVTGAEERPRKEPLSLDEYNSKEKYVNLIKDLKKFLGKKSDPLWKYLTTYTDGDSKGMVEVDGLAIPIEAVQDFTRVFKTFKLTELDLIKAKYNLKRDVKNLYYVLESEDEKMYRSLQYKHSSTLNRLHNKKELYLNKANFEFVLDYYRNRYKKLYNYFENLYLNSINDFTIDSSIAKVLDTMYEIINTSSTYDIKAENIKIEEAFRQLSSEIGMSYNDHLEKWKNLYKTWFEKSILISLNKAKEEGHNIVYLNSAASMYKIEGSEDTALIYATPYDDLSKIVEKDFDETEEKYKEKISKKQYGPWYTSLAKIKGIEILGLERPNWSNTPLLKVDLTLFEAPAIERFQLSNKKSGNTGLYLQQSNTKSEQDRIVNKLLDGESRITYNPKDINKDKDNKHSGYSLIDKVTGAVKKIVNRVSNIAEELDKNRNFPPRSDSDKAIDDIKRNAGISIHNALNNIAKRFIEGLSGTPATQVDMFGLSPGMYTQLEAQFDNIVKSLPPDTKWLSELKVYDPAEDRAGTIDLIAIDAKGKVHIFDFKSIDLYGKETIPKNKKENWNVQITAYKRILSKVYGVKDFGMLRAIPIQTNYKMVNKVLTLWSVKVANKDLSLEKDERLLPVPISGMVGADIERTGDEKTDALIDRLLGQLDRIVKKTEYEDEAKIRKVERILELNKAIRDLQVFHDIKSFIDGALYEILRLQKADLRKLDEQEIGNAANLLEFYSTLKAEGVISEVQETKYDERLMKLINISQKLLYEVRKVQKEMVLRLGTNAGNSDILTATPETSLWGRLFRSASQSTHPIINTLYKLVMKQRDKTYTRIMEIQDKISTLHDKLVEWGNSNGLQGLDVFKPLLQYDEKGEWTGRLANKFSKKFRDLKEKAISEKDVEWILANTTFNKEKYEEVLANNIKYWKNVFAGRPDMDEKVEERVQSFRRQFDPTLKSAVLNKKNWYLQPTSKWESEEMKYIKSHPALLNYYNYFTELMKEYHSYLEFDFYGNFVPNIENSLLQQIWDGGLNSYIGLNMSHVFDAKSDGMIGMVDERGEVTHEIPTYFTREIDPNIKSRDLTKSLLIFSQMALNNKHMQEIESSALLLKEAISNAPSLLTDAAGKPIMNKLTHKLAKIAKSSNDIEQFNNYLLDYMYGIKTDGKDYIFDNGVSGKRVFSTVMSTFSVTKLSLNMFTAFANGVGGTANGFFEGARGRFYNNQQFSKAFANMVSRDSKTVLLSHFFDIDSNESTFKKAERLSASSVLKNFTFDKFHILQRSGDYVVENMVLGAMLESHTIDNGKIRKKKEGERSLYELSEIVNDRIVIPGLQAEEFGKFRRKVKYLYSELKGNNNPDDISQIRRTVLGQALMQFRNWIPRMADERLGNLRYTSDLDVWEEGKFRTFLAHITKNMLTNIPSALFANGIVGIGKHSMDETLTKAADYEWERMFAKNPNLKITKEEYREVYIGNIRATIAELQTVLALVILLVVAKPNGDDGKDSKRRLFLRLAKRTMNELSFWIDPDANMSILKTPIPVVGIVNDTGALLSSVFKASWYKATGDQDKYDKIYVTRDFFRLFPIASSIETTYSTISPRKR